MKENRYIIKEGYLIFYLNELDENIKELIRNKLISICRGFSYGEENDDIKYYKRVIKEFLIRLNSKEDFLKIGIVGEFLVHLIVSEYLQLFNIDSLFFNTEERNNKKGFDIVLNRKETTDIWLAEVKSGEYKRNNLTSKTISLIKNACNDLQHKINDNRESLWINAYSSAKNAMKDGDEKKAILSILSQYEMDSGEKSLNSTNFNSILSGVVFNTTDDEINEIKINDLKNEIVNKKIFHDVLLIAIDNKVYQEFMCFLEDEVK